MHDWYDQDSQITSCPHAAKCKGSSAWFGVEVVLISVPVISGYIVLGLTVTRWAASFLP